MTLDESATLERELAKLADRTSPPPLVDLDRRAAAKGLLDIAYATWGTICWLPDLMGWAQTSASLLVPGGYFYFADAHPNMLILEDRGGRLVHEFPLDTPADDPLVFDEEHTDNEDRIPHRFRCKVGNLHVYRISALKLRPRLPLA